MDKLIDVVGGKNRAIDIVNYQKAYFRNFTYYDNRNKVFSKIVDCNRTKDFIPVKSIELELRMYQNV